MRKVIIKVTQQDIDRGIKGDCEKCPIGLAVQRCLTGMNLRKFYNSTEAQEQPLPPIATEFMRKFDAGEVVTPFEFAICI
jgi:hypothetical protein